MGIIRAAVDTARGTLADQWLDVVEAGEMGEADAFTGDVGANALYREIS